MKRLLFSFYTICTIFCFFGRTSVNAASSPQLLNSPQADFIVNAFCKSQSLDCSENIKQEDIVEEIFLSNEFYRFGKRHSIQIEDRAVIGLEFKLQDIYTEEEVDSILQNSNLVVKTPSQDYFAVAAKHLMVLELFERGTYEIGFVSSRTELYNVNISRLRSPFVGDFTFIDKNTDFLEYKKEFERYIELGGNAIIYGNEDLYRYFEVTEDMIVLEDFDKLNTQIDFIFDNYYEAGDKVYQLTSDLVSQYLCEYRNIPMVLMFENSFAKGKVFILNPSLTTLEKVDIEKVFEIGLKDVSVELLPAEDSHNYISYLPILLLFFIIVLIFGREAKGVITSENYFQDISARLEGAKSKLGPALVFLNIVFGIFIFLFAGGMYYLNRLYVTGNLASELGNIYIQIDDFVKNYELGGIADLALLVITMFLLVDLALLAWIKSDLILNIRNRIVGAVQNKYSKKVRSRISTLSFVFGGLGILFLLFNRVYVVSKIQEYIVALGVILFLLIALVFKVRNRDISCEVHKNVRKLYGVVLLLVPLSLLVSILYSHVLPFGLDKCFLWEARRENSSNLEVAEQTASSLTFGFTPRFNQEDVSTSMTQNLRSQNSVYVELNSDTGEAEKYLFFDQAFANFEYKIEVDSKFVYSKKKPVAAETLNNTLNSVLVPGSLLGLDLETVSFSDINSELDKFRIHDYYKDSAYEPGDLDLDLGIAGNQVYYTILKDSLDLSISYRDENADWGRDAIVIRVSDSSGEVIVSKYVEDDNEVLNSIPKEHVIRLTAQNLPEGIYRIEIASDDFTTAKNTLSQDLIVTNIKLNSNKFVYSGLESAVLEIENIKEVYFYPLERGLSLARKKSSDSFEKVINGGPETFKADYWNRYYNYKINVSALTRLSAVTDRNVLSTKYNLYSFTKDSYFYPFRYYFAQIDNVDEAVITRSNLQIHETGDNWYNSTLDIRKGDFGFGVPVYYKFYLSQTNLETFNDYELDTLTLKLEK
ncbi:MAG: hypothetical protein ABIE03_03045 [Patescibacteria group bacterium]|nr:hypothetical protein [Patescibacteria group bacterium]